MLFSSCLGSLLFPLQLGLPELSIGLALTVYQSTNMFLVFEITLNLFGKGPATLPPRWITKILILWLLQVCSHLVSLGALLTHICERNTPLFAQFSDGFFTFTPGWWGRDSLITDSYRYVIIYPFQTSI